MRNRWIHFGCFLSGFNYDILTTCSEQSVRRVLRYTSAMIIPCVLWAFVGYTFTDRYLKLQWYFALIGGVIMLIMVIQIERQVILSNQANRAPFIFRCVIAFLMAVIGSVIIDQIIFKEDIEQEKILLMGQKVDEVYPGRAKELRHQIAAIDSSVNTKETERKELVFDISKNPKITVYSSQVVDQKIDTTSTQIRTRSSTQISNPKMSMLEPLDDQIQRLRVEKIKKDSMLLTLRPAVEAELRAKGGFLDEINLMMSIMKKSTTAMVIWIVWFLFIICIELFILVSKWSDNENDYDKMLDVQMKIHEERISLLRK